MHLFKNKHVCFICKFKNTRGHIWSFLAWQSCFNINLTQSQNFREYFFLIRFLVQIWHPGSRCKDWRASMYGMKIRLDFLKQTGNRPSCFVCILFFNAGIGMHCKYWYEFQWFYRVIDAQIFFQLAPDHIKKLLKTRYEWQKNNSK